MSEGEWTCEGKPKSVCAEYIQAVYSDGRGDGNPAVISEHV